MADRPSACASCGKRLSKKSWYYRNGQYFCKKRCWETATAKAQEAPAEGSAGAADKSAGKAEQKPADATPKASQPTAAT